MDRKIWFETTEYEGQIVATILRIGRRMPIMNRKEAEAVIKFLAREFEIEIIKPDPPPAGGESRDA